MRPYVVAAERGNPEEPRAHALEDLGPATHLGHALCGFPATHLTIVRDLDWRQVAPASRCGHCWRAADAAE